MPPEITQGLTGNYSLFPRLGDMPCPKRREHRWRPQSFCRDASRKTATVHDVSENYTGAVISRRLGSATRLADTRTPSRTLSMRHADEEALTRKCEDGRAPATKTGGEDSEMGVLKAVTSPFSSFDCARCWDSSPTGWPLQVDHRSANLPAPAHEE